MISMNNYTVTVKLIIRYLSIMHAVAYIIVKDYNNIMASSYSRQNNVHATPLLIATY